jgi:hypothetical protein
MLRDAQDTGIYPDNCALSQSKIEDYLKQFEEAATWKNCLSRLNALTILATMNRDNLKRIKSNNEELEYNQDLINLKIALSGFFHKVLGTVNKENSIYILTLVLDHYLGFIKSIGSMLRDITSLLILKDNKTDPYPQTVNLDKNKTSLCPKSLKILDHDNLIIEINVRICLLIVFIEEGSYGQWAYDLLVCSGYQIMRVESLKDDSVYGFVYEAFNLLKNILDKINESSLLFNLFSFANSRLVLTNDDRSVFEFSSKNTFDLTIEYLKDLLPRYVVLFNSNKYHKGRIHGITFPPKLIFINTHEMGERKEVNTLRTFLTLLHECFHIKRLNFSDCFLFQKTPTNLNTSDSTKKGKLGFYVEDLLLGNDLYEYLINAEYISDEDLKYLMKLELWSGNMVELRNKVSDLYSNEKNDASIHSPQDTGHMRFEASKANELMTFESEDVKGIMKYIWDKLRIKETHTLMEIITFRAKGYELLSKLHLRGTAEHNPLIRADLRTKLNMKMKEKIKIIYVAELL